MLSIIDCFPIDLRLKCPQHQRQNPGEIDVSGNFVDRDEQTVETIHAKLGKPARVVEYERGFDIWRIEWYGNQKYIFRNHVFQKTVESEQYLNVCD